MSREAKLKEFIINRDIDLVGIAAASALANEPEGHRPEDILPGAKSIVVFARSFADGAVQADFRYHEDKVSPAQSSYAAYASDLAPNFMLINDSNEIALHIEDTYGEVAVPLPFHVQQSMTWDKYPAPLFADPYAQGMPLNVFQAAVAAGIGEYGWSHRVVTEEYGPRILISAVLTTLELVPDAPYDGPALCDPEKCGICAKVCPTHALKGAGEGCSCTLSVEGKSTEVGDLNPNACAVASMAMRKEFKGRIPVPDLIMNDDPTDEELEAAFEKKPINGLSVDHFPRYFCDRCLLYCPLGNWKERFFETGFTTFDPDAEKAGA